MNSTYYEILEVTVDVDSDELKRAFSIMIRRYSNEKYPEKSAQLREAYRILIDPKLRKDYDFQLEYGQRIERLKELALEASKTGFISEVKDSFNEIITIQPSATHYYEYALMLMKLEDYEEAEHLLHTTIQTDEEFIDAYIQLAILYSRLEQYRNMVRVTKQGLLIAPANYELVSLLIKAYLCTERYEEAWAFIEKLRLKPHVDSQKHAFYLCQFFEICCAADSATMYEQYKQIIAKHPFTYEAKQLLIEELQVWIEFLCNSYTFNWAYNALYIICLLRNEGNLSNNAFLEELQKKQIIYSEFQKLSHDKTIGKLFRKLFYIYLFKSDYASEHEWEEHNQFIHDDIEWYANENYQSFKKDVKRLEIKYPALFKCKQQFFNYLI